MKVANNSRQAREWLLRIRGAVSSVVGAVGEEKRWQAGGGRQMRNQQPAFCVMCATQRVCYRATESVAHAAAEREHANATVLPHYVGRNIRPMGTVACVQCAAGGVL